MPKSIKIDSVFLNFKDHKVLRGVSFEFCSKKVTGILGRNGSGKSCFLKIITGQLTPASKHLTYGEKRFQDLYKIPNLINYLPQHNFHPKSINLKKLIQLYNLELDIFLSEYPFLQKNLTNNFGSLSGGEKRIIEVLLVLEANTKFTILDEPFSHVMPIHLELIKERMEVLKNKKGILITDHQYENVMETADHLFLLREGVLKKIQDMEDLKFNGYIR